MYQPNNQCCNQLLYIISVISNPMLYERRYTLFNEFVERTSKNKRVKLLTVELAQSNTDFRTNADIRLKGKSVLWVKENLMSVGVNHLPRDWQYVAFVDSDITFMNHRFVEDTLNLLQIHPIVQLFSHAVELGPKKEVLQVHTGFGYQHYNRVEWKKGGPYSFFHPGYAWAWTRKIYTQLGGLIERAILGSADHHMALAMIHKVDESLNRNLHPNYIDMCKTFENRCKKYLMKNIGYTPGAIYHEWHGDKKDRQYITRWEILVKHNYDPYHDVKEDSDGLLELEEGEKPELMRDLITYFSLRNEDSISRNQEYRYTKKDFV